MNLISKLMVSILISTSGVAIACRGELLIREGVLAFSGCINEPIADRFIVEINNKPRVVLIQSTGGDALAAIRMAKAIYKNNSSLVIRDICYSACANYLMPAAKNVVVEDGAIIGYHGDIRIFGKQKVIDFIDKNKHPNPKVSKKDLLRGMTYVFKQEMELAKTIPRVERTHELQMVASAPSDTYVPLKNKNRSLLCQGQGNLPWFPTLKLLKELNLIDEIVNNNNELFSDLERIDINDLKDLNFTSPTSENPELGCKTI